MSKAKANKIWPLIKVLFFIYLGAGLLAFLLQDFLIFHPQRLPPNYRFSFKDRFTELNIKAEGDRNISVIRFHPAVPATGVVLYFHGNMRNIERYAPYAGLFTKWGYDVWMIDYPGFGKSTGKASEQRMYDDAMMLYNMAAKQFDADKTIIYGKSLGTGVASHVAARGTCNRLILETPYYSMKDLAKQYLFLFPVDVLLKYSFPTHENLKKNAAPVTIFHGTKDEVIPYKQSVKLVNEYPSLELVTIKNGRHNNLSQFPLFSKKLDEILGASHLP
jgi:alpha-beta hydrolase superfamily lysophospholipase